jgi:hypothetical protein
MLQLHLRGAVQVVDPFERLCARIELPGSQVGDVIKSRLCIPSHGIWSGETIKQRKHR